MKPPRSVDNELILGLVSISDRASRGVYDDEGIPHLEAWCRKAITTPIKVHKRLIPDERFDIEKTLRELVDIIGCDLILTTGGTGPARRDVTPEATLAVATREMPGFGEQMRAISGHFVPTAILSRQVGVLRETPDHAALIINLPGRPKAIAETLEGLKDESGKTIVNGIFAAVPYCIDLIGGPYVETNPAVVKAFRPKSAERPKSETAQTSGPAQTKPAGTTSTSTAQTPAPQAEPIAEPAASVKPAVPAAQKVEGETEPKKTLPAPAFEAKDILTVMPRRASRPAELTVVWLHGMGADNRDFVPFPDELLDFGAPVCRFVLPNAPVREISAHPGYPLRAWYDIRSDRIDENEDRLGIEASAERIARLIDGIAATGVPYERIILGGFSQGAAISLHTGLRLRRRLGGIVALSGYLPLATRLYAEASDAGRRTPVFMAHGVFDNVVSPMIAERSAALLNEVNRAFVWRTYDIDHELGRDEVADLAAFLRTIAG